jgi:hypothetical protein
MASTKIFQDKEKASIVRIDDKGAFTRSVVKVVLRPELKHFYMGKGVKDDKTNQWVKPRIITATGFDHINKHSPMSWIPQATLVNEHGVQVGNPYIVRRGSCIESVRVRRFAVGRTMDGQLKCHDLTLIYEPLAYLNTDLLADFEAKKLGPDANIVSEHEANIQSKELGLHKIEIAPSIYLVFSLAESQARARLKEYSERTKFADRLATSICDRNLLAKFWGMRVVPECGYILVPQWHQDKELTPEKLESGIVTRGGVIVIDGEEIQVESAIAAASDEDLDSMKNDVTDEGELGGNEVIEQEPGRTPEQLVASIRNSFVGGDKKKLSAAIAPILKEANVKQADIPSIDDVALLEKIEKALIDQ